MAISVKAYDGETGRGGRAGREVRSNELEKVSLERIRESGDRDEIGQ